MFYVENRMSEFEEPVKQEVEEVKQEVEELITKPKKKRVLTDEEKVKFLDRMKTGRDKKKTNTIKVESVYKSPPIEPAEEEHVVTKRKPSKKDNDVNEILQFVRDYKQRKETKKVLVEPVKKKVVPDDVYQNRVQELKQNYLSKQVLKDLFGE